MNLMEIYDRIENPLNLSVINKLIEVSALGTSMDNNIMSLSKNNNSRVIEADKERMYNEMFSSWKDMILSLKEEDAVKLYEKGLIDQDFVKLRNFVNTNKESESHSDFLKLLEEGDLRKTYDKYRWDSKGLDGPWTYCSSNKIYAHKHADFEIEHRLYINTNAEDTYKMANLFREKCDNKNLPYMFKFSESPFRDDSIVIYASSPLLEEYMKVLSEIKQEEPNLISRINNPPVLSGKMGYVGYGSEPSIGFDGRSRSFTKMRADLIQDTIYKMSREWFLYNRGLSLNGVTIEDAIVKECTKRTIDSMKRKYNDIYEYEKTSTESRGFTFNENVVVERLGYSKDVLDSVEVKDAIGEVIRKDVVPLLEDRDLFKKIPTADAIYIPMDNNKKFTISYYDITRLIKQSIPGITKFDQTFAPRVLKEIKDKAVSLGIDPDKFCFDSLRVRNLRKYHSGVKEEKKKDLKFPTFEELKEYALKYKVQYDKKDERLKVYDINSNDEETNAIEAQNALFANIWLVSAGVKQMAGEARMGISYAFNDEARQIYEYLIRGSEHSIGKTGDLNSLFLFKNSSKLGYKYDEEIIAKLFGNELQTKFLDNYIQNRCSSTLPKNREAQTLGDVQTAYNLLDAMKAPKDNDKKM